MMRERLNSSESEVKTKYKENNNQQNYLTPISGAPPQAKESTPKRVNHQEISPPPNTPLKIPSPPNLSRLIVKSPLALTLIRRSSRPFKSAQQ
ncbi:hypothetical protein CDAR_27861 [Caerostris darwini]|uniref:Uncharacterized protein n=1 Tax=Caerostris darwini TaxID=1538125 RepID=A0AAV4SR47_9ARAC|nr:hypothetical protein CDAR_27861 [Caerostris darwini]